MAKWQKSFNYLQIYLGNLPRHRMLNVACQHLPQVHLAPHAMACSNGFFSSKFRQGKLIIFTIRLGQIHCSFATGIVAISNCYIFINCKHFKFNRNFYDLTYCESLHMFAIIILKGIWQFFCLYFRYLCITLALNDDCCFIT